MKAGNAQLPAIGAGQPIRMNSVEIGELVEARHDSVRRTIERLAADGLISLPPLEDVKTKRERRVETTKAYIFEGDQGERDSIVVVARLSPEFTARLVDQWRAMKEVLQAQIASSAKMNRRAADPAVERRLTMNQMLKLATMAGLSGNQALLAANRATVAMTGYDTLGLMGISHMDAPQNEALLSPTEIGNRIGNVAARTVNDILCRLGLQFMFRDTKNRPYYEPTDAGAEAGGIMQDTERRHSNGAPVRQLRWASSIIPIVADSMRREGSV